MNHAMAHGLDIQVNSAFHEGSKDWFAKYAKGVGEK